jgi:hypothetical protein
MTDNGHPLRPKPRSGKTAPRRRGAARAALVLLLVAVPLGFYLYQHRPNLYDRTRIDLLEASREIDTFDHAMELLVQEDQQGAEAFGASLSWLQKAAASDPDDLAEINAIATDLQRWKQLARAGTLSSGELQERYRLLADRVDRLIKKHSQTSQTEHDLKKR